MPKASKGARLYLRTDRATGTRRWIIRDGDRQKGTGCLAHEIERAEQILAQYVAEKYAPERRERDISQIPVADVIRIYLDDVAPGQARPEKAFERARRLNEFFGHRMLGEITGALCRDYRNWRGSDGGARRDLQDLQAAINHHATEGLHRNAVRVSLPARGKARQRWLTRDEAARLLWDCWRTRETQNGVDTKKRPLRHLCRFLLIGLYTGSRPGAILNASWFEGPGLSYVDTTRMLFHRHAAGSAETNKRQPTVRLTPRLAAHLERWKRIDAHRQPRPVFVVNFSGGRILSVKTAMQRACRLAKLEAVTGYTLRHTCASWLVAKGFPTRDIAEYLGTTEEIVRSHYGHLGPNYQEAVAEAIGRK